MASHWGGHCGAFDTLDWQTPGQSHARSSSRPPFLLCGPDKTVNEPVDPTRQLAVFDFDGTLIEGDSRMAISRIRAGLPRALLALEALLRFAPRARPEKT